MIPSDTDAKRTDARSLLQKTRMGQLALALFSSNSTARSLVNVKVYLDESGKGKQSPYFVLGGYIGRPEAWAAFESDWEKSVLDGYDVPYMHAVEMWNNEKRSPFEDKAIWTIQRMHDVTATIGMVIRRHSIVGFGICIGKELLDTIYSNTIGPIKKHMPLQGKKIPKQRRTAYSASVTHLLAHLPYIVGWVGRNGRFHEKVLTSAVLIFDDGNSEFTNEAKTVVKILREQWRERAALSHDSFDRWDIDDPIERDDKRYPGLQAADTLVYLFRRDLEGRRSALGLLLDEKDPEKHLVLPIELNPLLNIALGNLPTGMRAGPMRQLTKLEEP